MHEGIWIPDGGRRGELAYNRENDTIIALQFAGITAATSLLLGRTYLWISLTTSGTRYFWMLILIRRDKTRCYLLARTSVKNRINAGHTGPSRNCNELLPFGVIYRSGEPIERACSGDTSWPTMGTGAHYPLAEIDTRLLGSMRGKILISVFVTHFVIFPFLSASIVFNRKRKIYVWLRKEEYRQNF